MPNMIHYKFKIANVYSIIYYYFYIFAKQTFFANYLSII